MKMVDTSTEAVTKLLAGVTPGRAVQFHPRYCDEAKDAPFSDWDTSHHVSVIRDDGSRYRVAEFRHSSDAAFYQTARDLVPALLAERDALKAEVERLKAQPAQAVKVKPLEWDVTGWQSGDGIKGENDDTWSASAHGFQYCAYCIDWHGGADFRLTDPDNNRTSHQSLSAAKSAAQADYDARIMAALDVQPITAQDAARVPEIKALIDAAMIVHDSYWNSTDGVIRGMYDLGEALRAITEYDK